MTGFGDFILDNFEQRDTKRPRAWETWARPPGPPGQWMGEVVMLWMAEATRN